MKDGAPFQLMKEPALVWHPIQGQTSMQHDAAPINTAADSVGSIDADQHAARCSIKVWLTAPTQTT